MPGDMRLCSLQDFRSVSHGGEYEESIEYLEKAKALAPEDPGPIDAELARVKEEMQAHDAKVRAAPEDGVAWTSDVYPGF